MLNPAKMKALVDQHSAGPSAAALGMPPPGEPMDEEDAEEEDGTEPVDPSARGEELLASWGEFGESLKESADLLHDNAHDVGAELLLKEVPPDASKKVGKSVDRMPDEISMGLAKYVAELSPEDCEALVTALAATIGEDKADVGLMCAYVKLAAAYAKEEVDVDEDFNEPEEDEDAEEEPAEEAPEGGEPPPGPPA